MFDLTKNIKLGSKERRKYAVARLILYLAFLAGVFFVADKILLPSSSLDFSFKIEAGSEKNTIVYPRTNSSNPLKDGSVLPGDDIVFNANPVGSFSDAIVTFIADKDLRDVQNASVKLRKSYTAFFFPDGEPMGFRNGTLLSTSNNAYYIVSDGKLRKFSNADIASGLGYSKNSFLQVSSEDLIYNEPGKDITETNAYPDGSLFLVEDRYYRMEKQELLPFVSAQAFLSQYDSGQAIAKDRDFLSKYVVSENILGFADGTLGSFGISAFILSSNKSYPITNAETFVLMGFNWEDIVTLDSEELGLYDKQKVFTRSYPHPDGTLFLDQKIGKYFVIENGKKRPIESKAVEKTYSKQKPILADLEMSKKEVSCTLKKSFFNSRKYSCTAPLEEIESFIGNDYQIDATFANNVKIDEINVTFFRSLSWQNIRSSLSNIKLNIINNYTQQIQ